MNRKKRGTNVFPLVMVLIAVFIFFFDKLLLAVPLKVINKPFDLRTLTQVQKAEDFEYLYHVLKENYPYFKVNKTHFDLESEYDVYYDKMISSKTNEEFLLNIHDMLQRYDNGHTNLERQKWDNASFTLKSFYYLTPRRTIFFNKDLQKKIQYWQGLYQQIQNEQEDIGNEHKMPRPKEAVQAQIIEPGKTAYLQINSFSTRKENIEEIDAFIQEIKAFKHLVIDIRWNGGGSDFVWRDHLVKPLAKEDYSASFYIAARTGDYVQPFLRSIVGGFGFSYGSLKEASQYKDHLGDDFPQDLENWLVIQQKIAIAKSNKGGFQGDIYLLTGDNVFSASETFAAFSKESGFATLIGTRTGGDGVGYDPAHVVLPNSGILIRFPVTLSVSNGQINELFATQPDIWIEQNPDNKELWYTDVRRGDVTSKYDTVLQECLKLCK